MVILKILVYPTYSRSFLNIAIIVVAFSQFFEMEYTGNRNWMM